MHVELEIVATLAYRFATMREESGGGDWCCDSFKVPFDAWLNATRLELITHASRLHLVNIGILASFAVFVSPLARFCSNEMNKNRKSNRQIA